MKDAIERFSKPENMKWFVIELMNGHVTPFIQTLSAMNMKEPQQNALELQKEVSEYLIAFFRMAKHFDEKDKMKTFQDYIHKNTKASRLAVDYVLTNLQNRHSEQEYAFILSAMLEPHMASERRYGGDR